jgi:outer membrane protein TolC
LQAKNGIDLTKRQLKMYLSIPEETEIFVVGSLDDFRDAVLLGADYEIDLANNTTMKSLELQQELLEHQEKLIQTTRMPTLAAFGQISYIGQEPSNFGGLMGGGAKTSAVTRAGSGSPKFWWQYPISLGAQISIPIFSGFSKTNQLREVRNQQAQLEIQRDYTERGLMLQVQTSVNNLITAREMMMANELTVQQAQKAYEISESRYNAGAGTILELNSSQLTLTQAQLNYSQSIYDYLSAHAEYEKALGVEYGAQEQVAE